MLRNSLILSSLLCVFSCSNDASLSLDTPATVEEYAAAAKQQATSNCDAVCILQLLIDNSDPVADAEVIALLEVVISLIEAEQDTPVVLESNIEQDTPVVLDSNIEQDTPVVLDSNIEQDTPVALDSNIEQDTPVPAEIAFSPLEVNLNESSSTGLGPNISIIASKNAPIGGLDVNLTYTDGTAILGTDYKATITTLTIPEGRRRLSERGVTIAVDNNFVNAPRQYTIDLSTDAVGWTVPAGKGRLTVTVINDDHLWLHVDQKPFSGPPTYTYNRPHDFIMILRYLWKGVAGSIVLPASTGKHTPTPIIPAEHWHSDDAFEVTQLAGAPSGIRHQIFLNVL